MKIHLASKNKCTACLACVDSCNKKAITPYIHKDGHLYVKIDFSLCVECGKCMEVCPVISQYDFEDGMRDSKPYAVWANDEDLRSQSASGGLFSALAVKILSDGGLVAGASMEGMVVKHILISNLFDLHRIQNSKYQQVDSSGIYRVIKEKLKQGYTILFGGTSCQIAGLNCFLKDFDYSGQLYTVDMICTGFPSNQALKVFLNNTNDHVQTIFYRDKVDGCLKGQRLSVIVNDDNQCKIKRYKHDLVYAAFGTHYTHRASCLACSYAHAQRKSDITMGDFWGDTNFRDEHEKGLSLAIIHTEKGKDLLMSADLVIHATTWLAVRTNFRIFHGHFYMLKFHPGRIFKNYFFKNCSYPTLLKLYRAEDSWKNILWLPYVIYSKVLGAIEKSVRDKIVKEEIKKLDQT